MGEQNTNQITAAQFIARLTSKTAWQLSAIEARFKGHSPWKKRLPRVLETLEAWGRAKQVCEFSRGYV